MAGQDQEPQATIIRVKHDESDDWFELVRNNNGLISFEAALLSGISAAMSLTTEAKINSKVYFENLGPCGKIKSHALSGRTLNFTRNSILDMILFDIEKI